MYCTGKSDKYIKRALLFVKHIFPLYSNTYTHALQKPVCKTILYNLASLIKKNPHIILL